MKTSRPSMRRRQALASGLLWPWFGSVRAAAELPWELGLLPNVSPRVLLAQYQPLRQYLERSLGQEVQMSTAASWTTFHERTASSAYQLVVTAAHLARLAQVDAGWHPLAIFSPAIKALIAQAKARPLTDIGALRGQTLVLSNPQSLVTMQGMRWLSTQGLERERDFRTIRTPADDSVGAVVVRGEAAAAMLSGGEFRAIPDAVREQLEVKTVFAEVPGFVVMASPRLSTEARSAVRAQLLQFGPGVDEAAAFFKSTGFTSVNDVPAGVLESLDEFVVPTRQALAG